MNRRKMSNKPDSHVGHLFVISSPSGGGKSTIIKHILEIRPDIEYSISATSRLPRKGEIDGKSYHFLSLDKFRDMISKGEFIEYEKVHDNYYGTTKKQIDDAVKRSVDLLMDLDVYGADRLKKIYPQAILIFLKPPSMEVLRQRLLARKSESPEEIERRLERGRHEVEMSVNYDYHVLNDDLETAVAGVVEIIDNIRRKP